MKKYIFSILLLVFLTSCGGPEVDIDQAKQEMLDTSSTSEQSLSGTTLDVSESSKEETDNIASQEPLKAIEITPLSEDQFIELDTIDDSTIETGEVEIRGQTLKNVDKIEVLFRNEGSVYPDDAHTLQTFKPGDEDFKYRAASRFQVLDFGINVYTLRAHSGDDVSETEVIIRFIDPEANVVTFEEKIIGTEDASIEIPLPVSESFGSPLSLGINSFTYSDINGLEIVKKDVSEISCDGLTETLQESINTWFYWNTCRDTLKDKGISYYVIRLEGTENYVYEKHYVDFIHSLYVIYEIETGTGVTKETISDKNTELKEINDTFESVSLVDSLVKTITIQK